MRSLAIGPSAVVSLRVLFLTAAVPLLVLPAAAQDVVLYAADATRFSGGWTRVADAAAAGGARLRHPNAGAAKLTSPLATPTHFFELTFDAPANAPLRLWIRGRADNNSWANDSIFAQFSDSVDGTGTARWRIGSTSAVTINLEDCSGCGISGWGWQDTGYGSGVLGPLVQFASAGPHTVRIQTREDGLSIDQVVLSASTWLSSPPGALKNDTTILPKSGSSGGLPPVATVVRGPYLQQLTETSVVVIWATRERGAGAVRVVDPAGAGRTVAGTDVTYSATRTGLSFDYVQHEVRVTGLSAGHLYQYDLRHDGAPLGITASFRTAPATGSGAVRFLAFGDSGVGSSAQRTLAALMTRESFDVALHTGDIAYGFSNGTGGGSYRQMDDWFFSIYRDWLATHAFWPSIGNHDDRINAAQAYRDLFVLPADAATGAYPDHAERYFSFDHGPVHFIALDTELAFQNTARRQAQIDWLKADLAATSQPWKIAYFHRSPYSAGKQHGSDLAVRQAFGPIFQQYGVQLAFSAHEHIYERTAPWRTSGAGGRPTVYVVTGGGGGPLYSAGTSEWTVTSRSAWHYVRTTINGCDAVLEAVGADGQPVDRYTLDRCAQTADAAPPTVVVASPSPGSTVAGTVRVDVEATDDQRVEKVDLWVDGTLQAVDATFPYAFDWNSRSVVDGTHTLEARAYDIGGRRTRSSATQVTVANAGSGGGADVVVYASDVGAGDVHGDWTFVADGTAAAGVRLRNPNRGAAKVAGPLATPANYVEATVNVTGGVPYHLWLRMKADGNSYANDSVYVQFSGTVTSGGSPALRIGTTSGLSVILEEGSGAGISGWGWNDNAYGTLGAPVTFAISGPQTIRIQMREDGASFDQIVLSPSRYFTARPGATKNDATVVAK